jgi:hypothetical protein
MEKITKHSISFGLIALACGFSALAGSGTTTRKPASAIQCGTQEMAAHVAVREAVYENHESSCNAQSVQTDGPAGSFLTTYHVNLSCSSKATYDYDVETHLMGTPGKMVCTSSIHPTGTFEAQ